MKKTNRFKKTYISDNERRRRKRELILIVVTIAVITLLTFAENRVIHFGPEFPISNTILMFILININLLLLILLIFLVFRNLVKLLYDRRRKVMGAKLRTRLVVSFIAITLVPTSVLFFFSFYFITASIDFWFNVPVEQALENSLQVGTHLYEHVESNNRFYLKRISYQLKTRNLLKSHKRKDLFKYIQVAQRAFNVHAVEVYASHSGSRKDEEKAERLTYAIARELEDQRLNVMSVGDIYKEIYNTNKVRSVSEFIEKSELRRTIGTVPFGADYKDAEAYVVLSTLIPKGLSQNLKSIESGFKEYKKIELLKEPIKITYYITISIVALLVLFCAVWFGFYLAKTISVPIKELAEGTRRVAEGDLSFSIGLVADDEIGSLVDSFNRMTKDLRISREQLELSAHILRQQNIEIEERRRYMEIVLKNVSTGVVTLDADGFVITTNTAAERMLNINPDDILNKGFKYLLKGQNMNIAREVMDNLSMSRDDSVEFPMKLTIDGSPRSFILRVNALKDETGENIGMVMVFDDLTELEKAQRMAAWREVARRIAHEVKNPLTPIKLSAQRLQRKFSTDLDEPIFDECTRMIIDHVDLIRDLVNEFSAFARFPTANPEPCDLPPIIEETVALYRQGHQNIHFESRIPGNIPRLNLDRRQIKQAMINLVTNAIGAIKEQGNIFISLSNNADAKKVLIEVADDGTGISDEDKTHLFEPYFSTKKTGMGLGLTIVSSIVADHNGRINVQDNQPQGAKFVIELPV
ncbi:MAG: HAMP domain-containing protein [Desulfobacterales bacterium]|nr:HAMP domain-containing protein [Desulfobacterales bacterium]